MCVHICTNLQPKWSTHTNSSVKERRQIQRCNHFKLVWCYFCMSITCFGCAFHLLYLPSLGVFFGPKKLYNAPTTRFGRGLLFFTCFVTSSCVTPITREKLLLIILQVNGRIASWPLKEIGNAWWNRKQSLNIRKVGTTTLMVQISTIFYTAVLHCTFCT